METARNRTRVRDRVRESVYKLSRRLIYSPGVRTDGHVRETSSLDAPKRREQTASSEPVSEAGAPPHGPRRTDSSS